LGAKIKFLYLPSHPFIFKPCLWLYLLLLVGSGCKNTSSIDVSETQFVTLPDSAVQLLQPGDIIIRKGGGPLSALIMRTTGEEYSHCGIISGQQDSLFIIHAIADLLSETGKDGVQTCPFDLFVAQTIDSALAVYRPKFIADAPHLVDSLAKQYLAKGASYDHRYDLATKDRIYCLELPYHVFTTIKGNNLFEIRRKENVDLLLFTTFFDTSNFELIYDLKGSKLN
jgi:hypothetical protein